MGVRCVSVFLEPVRIWVIFLFYPEVVCHPDREEVPVNLWNMRILADGGSSVVVANSHSVIGVSKDFVPLSRCPYNSVSSTESRWNNVALTDRAYRTSWNKDDIQWGWASFRFSSEHTLTDADFLFQCRSIPEPFRTHCVRMGLCQRHSSVWDDGV